MSTAATPFAIPKLVRRKVRWLRWLVRMYVAIEGLAAVVLVLGAAFWSTLAIDWVFEPSTLVRGLMWVAVVMTTALAATHYLFSRAIAPLPSSSLALLVERSYPNLAEGLVTTVEAADRRHSAPANELLLRRTSETTAEAMHNTKLSRVFLWRPLLWKSGVAILLVASIVSFAMLQSEAFGFWIGRMQFGQELWPRRVELSVVGFDSASGDRVVNVARDDDLELQVLASIRASHLAPDQVEIRYRRADGRRGRDTMTKIGQALPGRDEAQQFHYVFKKVTTDLSFDLIGGDDRIRDLRLHVVERPQILRLALECQYPAYMRRAPRTIPVNGRVELPAGSRAVCQLEATKPLREVVAHDPALQSDLPTTIAVANPHEASFDIELDGEDRLLLITMRDEDGVENRQPFRLAISSIPDEPPEVSVGLRGIGSAVTPQATIPLRGSVTDEYAIEEIWFSFQVDDQPPRQRAFSTQPRRRREVTNLDRFDLATIDEVSKQRRVDLEPGQQLALALRARDAYDLEESPRIGSSQRFLLDIVTDSELRARLEKRELALRQRFEAIYEKMMGTHELLTRIEIGGAAADDEADDEADDVEIERHQERDRLRIGGALQNVIQLAYETISIADGFDDIVAELINNRVDTEELKQRLVAGISQPLHEVGGQLMPDLEQRLQTLQQAFAEPAAGETARAAALRQGEIVLEAMKMVLDRMLELESYNELVELLRGIVGEQQQVQEQTKQLRRERLRSLLDDE